MDTKSLVHIKKRAPDKTNNTIKEYSIILNCSDILFKTIDSKYSNLVCNNLDKLLYSLIQGLRGKKEVNNSIILLINKINT